MKQNSDVFLSKDIEVLVKRTMMLCVNGNGFVSIVAPDGWGKSTFARHLASSLDIKETEVLLLCLVKEEKGSGWLMPRLAQLLGVGTEGNDPQKSMEQTLKRLDEIHEEGKSLVIVIDAAEKLSDKTAFSDIKVLLDLHNLTATKMSFVLLGSEAFTSALNNSGLLSKISFCAELPSFKLKDTRNYVDFYLDKNKRNTSLFTNEAVDQIHKLSGGIVSLINILIENCLIEVDVKGLTSVDDRMINSTAQHIPALNKNLKATPSPTKEIKQQAQNKVIPEQKSTPQTIPTKPVEAPEPTEEAQESPTFKLMSLFKKDRAS